MNQWVSDVGDNRSAFGGSAFHGQNEEYNRRGDRFLRNGFDAHVYQNSELSDTEVEDPPPSEELSVTNKKPKFARKQTARFNEGELANQERERKHKNQRMSRNSRPVSTMSTRQSNRGSTIFAKRFSMQPQKLNVKSHEEPSGRKSTMFRDFEDPQENEKIVGEEPGVDTENMTVDLPDSRGSQITIIDYSPDDCDIVHYDVEKDGESLISGSTDPEALGKNLRNIIADRPKWSKVRWIVVNGLSWESIQPIASYYRLHPLAVEDMLDIPQRIKMDTFDKQTFCCFPLHILNITPTPYSLLRKTARLLIIWMAWIINLLKFIFSVMKKKIFGYIAHQKKDDSLPRFQVNSRMPKNLVEDHSSENFDTGKGTSRFRKMFSWLSCGDSIESSQQTSMGETIDYENEDSCAPFYTLKHGRLCGDVESSEIAKVLQEMPSRSIYEWNHGNLSLKNEALQNMHIAGSTNSFEIAMEQVSLFIVDDVVITFFERSAPAIYQPLEVRLQSPMTFLRQTSDPIILVQAILDASVDLVGLILNEYRTRLNNLQTVSVPRPTLHHTRGLHAFITDMTVLRPHLSSVYQLIEALWPKLLLSRGDVKHATVDEKHANHFAQHHPGRKKRPYEDNAQSEHTHYPSEDWDDDEDNLNDSNETVDALDDTGFSSPAPNKMRRRSGRAASDAVGLYFGDVADHALRHLQDLDDMRNQSKTLSSLLFNTISIRAGDSVKLLSLVSVVFLPLTFLTGYFGMNFKTFSVLDNSVDYYWFVAAPATGALTAFLMYPSILDWIQDVWSWSRDQI